jgi:hypothetical protein
LTNLVVFLPVSRFILFTVNPQEVSAVTDRILFPVTTVSKPQAWSSDAKTMLNRTSAEFVLMYKGLALPFRLVTTII